MNKVFIPLFLLLFCLSSTVFAEGQAALEARLAYLKDIPEISWVEFDKNDVYIGFKKRTLDLKTIVHAAAVHGNNAYGSGVHVWAVEAMRKGWRPGDGPYYCVATARGGRIKDSDCR